MKSTSKPLPWPPKNAQEHAVWHQYARQEAVRLRHEAVSAFYKKLGQCLCRGWTGFGSMMHRNMNTATKPTSSKTGSL